MTIDKSWTSICNRNSGEFLRGLHVFLEYCKTLLDPISGEIACPCDLCAPRSLSGDAGGDPPDDRRPRLLPHQCEGILVKAGLQRDFARRYTDNKCKFKDKWFNKKAVEQARQEKQSKWKAGDAQWQKHVDFWSDPDQMKQYERNAANRAKNKV
nr:hypothetical protein [Tanacetum cinerariifolium]